MATAPTPITALPTPPSSSDPSSFDLRADNFLLALPTFRTEANALGTNAYNNALAAAASETTATTQVSLAAAQASSAAASASTASTHASNAAASASTAATQAGIATTQASNAAATYTNFDTRYLGVKSSDPILNNTGGILVTGALYFSSALGNMRIFNGTTWVTAAGTVTGSFTILRETIVATASQTLFNLANTYTPGINAIMIYKNGARLLLSDYTETSTNSVTLSTAATLGDELFFEIGVVASGTSTTAASTTFAPAGSISSGNVQAAITELDTEKQALLVSGTNIKTINSTSLLGSGDISLPVTLPFTNSTVLAQIHAITQSF